VDEGRLVKAAQRLERQRGSLIDDLGGLNLPPAVEQLPARR
jgi:hypothetical protein